MRFSFFVSLSLHASLMVVYLISIYFMGASVPLKDDGSFVVNFEAIGKVSKAPILSPMPQTVRKSPPKQEKIEKPKEEPKPEKVEKPKEEKSKEEPLKEDKDAEKISAPKDKKVEKPKAEKPKTEKPKTEESKKKEKPKKEEGKKEEAKPKKEEKKNDQKSDGEFDSKIQNEGEGQRASEVGDVITASEVGYIKYLVKKLWNIPTMVRTWDVSVVVKITLDENGKVKKATVEPNVHSREDPELYELLINSIEAVVYHPDFKFDGFSGETRQMLDQGKLLVLEFNPAEVSSF